MTKMSTKESLTNEVQNFTDNWSGHGVHRIAISRNIIKKLFYTGVFITCLVLFAVQMRKLFIKYYSFPKNTVIEIKHAPLRFPAVTICNKNIVRKSKLSLGGSVLEGIINRTEASLSSGTDYYYYDGSGSGSWSSSGSGSGSGGGTDSSSGSGSGDGTGSSSGSGSGDGTGSSSGSGSGDGTGSSSGSGSGDGTGSSSGSGSGDGSGSTSGSGSGDGSGSSSGSGSGDGSGSSSGSWSGHGTASSSGSGSGDGSVSSSGSGSGEGTTDSWSGSGYGYPYYDYGYYGDDYSGNYGMPTATNDLFEVGSGDVYFEPEEVPWLTAGKATGESEAVKRISMALVKVNITSRLEMGHQLKEMLQSCSINGETCSTKNFTSFYNVQYGNCYTFNGMKTARPIRTFQSGPASGLNLQLVIEQDEYIGSLTRTAGARLTVHDPFDFPFPEDNGIDLSPGKLTSVGLKLVVEKLGEPYSQCTNGRGIQMAYTGKYTVEACRKTCLQDTIVRNCNCTDTRYSNANFYKAKPCDNDTDYQCITDTMNEYHRTDYCNCPAACIMKVYAQTVSTADFPSYASESELRDIIMKRSSRLEEIFNTSQEGVVNNNLLQVQIFFESLQYEKITEQAAYDFETLLSDVGGQAGLLIGWSVITIVEVIEFIGNMLWIVIKKLLFRQNLNSDKVIKVAPAN